MDRLARTPMQRDHHLPRTTEVCVRSTVVDMAPPHQRLTGAWSSVEEQPAKQSTQPVDPAKRGRALRKKLGQIDALKERQQKGEQLDADQVAAKMVGRLSEGETDSGCR